MFALPTLRAASGSYHHPAIWTRNNSTQAGGSAGQGQAYGSAARSTVPPRSTHATYHPGGYGVSEGLKRARKPYRVKNLVTGSLIVGFATSVYFYSISKVRFTLFRMPIILAMALLTSLFLASSRLTYSCGSYRSSKTTSRILQRSGLQLASLLPSQPSRITSTKCNQLSKLKMHTTSAPYCRSSLSHTNHPSRKLSVAVLCSQC